MDLMQLLASVLNPNPGVVNHLTGNPTGLGPDQLARYHQQSGMGAPQDMLTRTADAGAPPPSFMAPQQPIAPQMAPQAQPQPSRPGGGLGGFLGNLLNPGAAGRNQTMQWLQGQGLDEGTAAVLASDKQSLQQYIRDKVQGGGGSEFDQRARAAKQYGLDPASEEGRNYILSGDLPEARGGAAELSLQAIPGVDENGNAVLIQTSKNGNAALTKMPPGVKVSKPPLIKDTGTEFQVIDPITREIVQSIPKNVAGAAAQTALGKAQGEAAFDLPRAELNARQTVETIQKLISHPGREGSTGFFQGRLPAYSTNTQNFQNELKKAIGRTFLEAYAMLKGGGQITEIEGVKAQQAIANLERSTGDEDFRENLLLLQQAVLDGVEKLRRQANLPASPYSATPLTAPPSAQGFTQDPDTSKGDRVGGGNRVIKSVKDLSDEELEAIINGQ